MINNITKGKVLEYLYNNTDLKVLYPVVIESDSYFNNVEDQLDYISNIFKDDDLVIVRSSSSFEDQQSHSNAGKFISVSNVDVKDREQLKKAINDVYMSYNTKLNQEILIQPMAKNIEKSGVVFTGDVNTM